MHLVFAIVGGLKPSQNNSQNFVPHLVACGCCCYCPAGVKIGKFCVSEPPCDPDNVDREMAAADTEPLEQALRRHMPKAHGDVLNFAACMFTMTPDNHFVIDTHPRHPQVSLQSTT